MELFTLGEGHYSESDVKEAARAFTGWSLDRESGEFVFRRAVHDDGSKTVLGKTGNFDGDDVLDILLAQPATAEFVSRKLWREFVSPEPDPAEVKRIAARLSRVAATTSSRAARAADVGRVLRDAKTAARWSSRRSTWSSARCALRHASGRYDPVCRRRAPAWDRTCSRRRT